MKIKIKSKDKNNKKKQKKYLLNKTEELFLFEQDLDDTSIRLLKQAKEKINIDYKKTIKIAQKIAAMEKEKIKVEYIAEAIQYNIAGNKFVNAVKNSSFKIINGKIIRYLPDGKKIDEDVVKRIAKIFEFKLLKTIETKSHPNIKRKGLKPYF